MEVTKVSIAEETYSQLHPKYMTKISPKRKREIRFSGIKRLIESKYSGYEFTMAELIAAAGYKFNSSTDQAYNNGYAFISGLIKRGVLVQHSDHLGSRVRKAEYSVTNKSLHGRPSRNIVTKTMSELTDFQTLNVRKPVDGVSGTKNMYLHIHSKDSKSSSYSFRFTLHKRQESDHGKVLVSEIEVNDVTLDQIKKTVDHVVGNFESDN